MYILGKIFEERFFGIWTNITFFMESYFIITEDNEILSLFPSVMYFEIATFLKKLSISSFDKINQIEGR